MNIESRQIIEGYKQDGEAQIRAEAWGDARISFTEALEEFERIMRDEPENIITPGDLILQQEISRSLATTEGKLAGMRRQWGEAAHSAKDYARAIDEFEEAMRLASAEDVTFLEEVKQLYDEARVKATEQRLYADITPYVQRGDDFRTHGNPAEAILEYQEAFKRIAGLPDDHRFLVYLERVIRSCRRQLIKPYLTRIYRAIQRGRHNRAYTILRRAVLLLDEHDLTYQAFFAQIREDLNDQVKEVDDGEMFEAPEVWQQAIEDYEEAFRLYTTYTKLDPLSPVYADGNIYEDRFVKSRRKLARLYKNRADKFRDRAQFDKALRNYKEALKLVPRSDQLFHATFREMKKLRGQLPLSGIVVADKKASE